MGTCKDWGVNRHITRRSVAPCPFMLSQWKPVSGRELWKWTLVQVIGTCRWHPGICHETGRQGILASELWKPLWVSAAKVCELKKESPACYTHLFIPIFCFCHRHILSRRLNERFGVSAAVKRSAFGDSEKSFCCTAIRARQCCIKGQILISYAQRVADGNEWPVSTHKCCTTTTLPPCRSATLRLA